jgi:hypothetical protein
MIESHELKTWSEYFEAIIEPDILKRKHLEIRKDDRNYKVNDILILQEYNHEEGYSGRECWRIVTHCLRDKPFVPNGYVAMSILEISPNTMFA